MTFLNKYVFGTAVPLLLILLGIFYMFYLKFIHVRRIGVITRSLIKNRKGEGVSPLRALSLALAGTLGVGNIVGVSSAIALGGFGAVFWMWVSAFMAMLLKYSEIILAMKHRRKDSLGAYHGTAMCYIRDYFDSKRLYSFGRITAFVFAIFCILNSVSMGSMIQVNAVTSSFKSTFGISPIIIGIVLSITTAVIIARGSLAISKFTELLVPFMTVLYIILSFAVIAIKREFVAGAFVSIFKSAFSVESASGGLVGFTTSRAIRYGVMRGLVSNEAGCGTAPMAHATSNSKCPTEQGFLGIFEVFVDTIVLCTLTAIVVIVSYPEIAHLKDDFMLMTISAYSSVLGESSAYILTVSVLFFAFATIICWAHYGIESITYLSKNKYIINIYIAIYSLSVLIGSLVAPQIIWDVADLSIGAMTLINLIMLFLMRKEIRTETNKYF